mgnify:CR=1 FL=1
MFLYFIIKQNSFFNNHRRSYFYKFSQKLRRFFSLNFGKDLQSVRFLANVKKIEFEFSGMVLRSVFFSIQCFGRCKETGRGGAQKQGKNHAQFLLKGSISVGLSLHQKKQCVYANTRTERWEMHLYLHHIRSSCDIIGIISFSRSIKYEESYLANEIPSSSPLIRFSRPHTMIGTMVKIINWNEESWLTICRLVCFLWPGWPWMVLNLLPYS